MKTRDYKVRDGVNQRYALTWNAPINPGYPARKQTEEKRFCSEMGNKSDEMQRKSGVQD